MKFKQALWLVVAVCILATFWEPAAKFVETFGYIFVAIAAVWQHQFIDLFSPAYARVELLQDGEKFDAPEHLQHNFIHGRVCAKNPDRPLVNARVLFDRIQYDDGPLHTLPVPFQLNWSPSELNQHGISIGKDYEVFDLGMVAWTASILPTGDGMINAPPGQQIDLAFSIARRKFQGGFPLDERNAFKKAIVFLFLRADNLREDHRMRFEVDLDKKTCCLKEWGTEY